MLANAREAHEGRTSSRGLQKLTNTALLPAASRSRRSEQKLRAEAPEKGHIDGRQIHAQGLSQTRPDHPWCPAGTKVAGAAGVRVVERISKLLEPTKGVSREDVRA